MTPLLLTLVLTVLAAVVVVLTRVRLAGDGVVAGRLAVPRGLLNSHTASGTLALVVWSAYLLVGNDLLGAAGLVLWWATAAAGLLVLARWVPARGRHSSGPTADSWGEGPGLSVLAHVGLVAGAAIFTALFLLGELR